MKKVIASIVAMLAAVAMVACGNQTEVDKNEGEITTTTSATTTTVTTTEVTTNNTTTSDVTTENVASVSESEAENILTLAETIEEPVIETEQVTVAETEASVPEFVVPEVIEDWLVYKPSTHYAHRSTCRWNKGDAERCDDFSDKEIKICNECNPEIAEYIPYIAPSTRDEYSDWDITLLRRIVSSEYGADWVSVEEKAKIVASVIAQKRHGLANTIEGCLDRSCVPWGFSKYYEYYMSDSIIAAVDYYFEHENDVFAGWEYDSWFGDGTYNHFYRALY